VTKRRLEYTIGTRPARSLTESGRIEVPCGETVSFQAPRGEHWYGHGFAHRQPYPLDAGEVVHETFAVNNIQSPIWLCSTGAALLARTTAALSVRCNVGGSGRLDVRCAEEPVTVEAFCAAELPAAVREMLSALGWPNRPPPGDLFEDGIFCTWTQYPRCITQERVLSMARSIREHGYPCSVLTIDDRWETAFGELEFSGDFPDPAALVDELHSLGFRVLLWVTPFINEEARTFEPLERRGLLVRRMSGPGAARLAWWGGTAGLIDLTHPEGRAWYRRRLRRLQEAYGVDGFKIDGGDAKYQPSGDVRWHAYRGPSAYVDELLAVFEELAPGLCETRTAWLSHGRHVIWREGGKDSHWSVDNGLRAMVQLALHLAMMGYDLLIPDMIPGRVQTLAADTPLPTDELMVRWTEASAFLPLMQFSYVPWNYAPETAAACRGLAGVHKAIGEYVHGHARGRRDPLVRPLWYAAPERSELYTVGDEWLLGPDLLAAPVLEPGAAARDVVLPPGRWRDAWTGAVHEWPIAAHPAPCPGIPVFVRAANERLYEQLRGALDAIPRGTVPSGTTSTTYRAGLDRDLGPDA
jgi:hypothetical protein